MKLTLVIFSLVFWLQVSGKQLPISSKAESFILINAETGAILSEKNSKKLQYPASLTKIATTLYALDQGRNKLDVVFTAERDSLVSISEADMKKSNYTLPNYWLEPVATHMGLKVGEKVSFHDLLSGIMIVSAGDACNVVAQNIGGTVPKFMDELNAYLHSIGCNDTFYFNPHGLHHPEHQSTAYDLAIMTKEAMKDPTFRKIVKSTVFNRPETNKQKATTLLQSNKLLRKGKFYYPYALGVKTGFTTPAKHCFVAAASNEGRTLIAVLLKHPEREAMYLDAKMMFEKAFQEKKVNRTLIPEGPQKYTNMLKGAKSPLQTYVEEPAIISYYPSEEPQFKCFLCWDELMLPVKKGERVGELAIKDDSGQIFKRTILFAQEDVHPTLITRIKESPFIIVFLIVLVGSGIWFFFRKKE